MRLSKYLDELFSDTLNMRPCEYNYFNLPSEGKNLHPLYLEAETCAPLQSRALPPVGPTTYSLHTELTNP